MDLHVFLRYSTDTYRFTNTFYLLYYLLSKRLYNIECGSSPNRRFKFGCGRVSNTNFRNIIKITITRDDVEIFSHVLTRVILKLPIYLYGDFLQASCWKHSSLDNEWEYWWISFYVSVNDVECYFMNTFKFLSICKRRKMHTVERNEVIV